ncbi:Ff.00g032890.m01.CDS01 [Fusarium sp. VM40]|nr:Ff.00g032890.m01.CDS01 [Fusarium sp. VM40]
MTLSPPPTPTPAEGQSGQSAQAHAQDSDWDRLSDLSSDGSFVSINFDDASLPGSDHRDPLRSMMEDLSMDPSDLNPNLSSSDLIAIYEMRKNMEVEQKVRRSKMCEADKTKFEICMAERRGEDASELTAKLEQIKATLSTANERILTFEVMIAAASGKAGDDEDAEDDLDGPVQTALEGQATSSDSNSAAGGSQHASEDADVESEATSAGSEDSSEYEFSITTIHYPVLLVETRRILITVPFSVNIRQIANGISGVGGVISFTMLNTAASHTAVGNFSAMAEFRYAEAARAYLIYCSRTGLWFKDYRGIPHGVGVLAINTLSNPPVVHDDNPDNMRGVIIEEFPESAVWLLMNEFGLQFFVRVRFVHKKVGKIGRLELEFCNTFEAARFKRLIAGPAYRCLLSMDNVKFAMTRSDRVVHEINRTVESVIDYIPADHLEIDWNIAPYNTFVRTSNHRHGSTIRRRPVPSNASVVSIQADPSDSIVLDDSPAIVVQNDASRPVFRVPESRVAINHMMGDTKYAIVDGKIYALGSDDGGVYKYVSGAKLLELKETTVHLTHWATFWDIYCKVNNINNLRRYFEYSRYAAIRRAVNKDMGLDEGDARTDLADSPIPDVIMNYINPSNSNVVHTNNQ